MASFKRRLSTLNQRRSFSEDLSESGAKFLAPGQDLSYSHPLCFIRHRSGHSPTRRGFSTSEEDSVHPDAHLFNLTHRTSSDSWMGGFSTMDRPSDCLPRPRRMEVRAREGPTALSRPHTGGSSIVDITPILRIRLEPEGQLSSSPPSLICSLIPLSNNMADDTPVAASVLQQQYSLFETMDSTLKGRALRNTASTQLTAFTEPAARRCLQHRGQTPSSSSSFPAIFSGVRAFFKIFFGLINLLIISLPRRGSIYLGYPGMASRFGSYESVSSFINSLYPPSQ